MSPSTILENTGYYTAENHGPFEHHALGAFELEEGGGPFESISWDRTEDVVLRLLEKFRSVIRIERERQWLWVLVQGKQSV